MTLAIEEFNDKILLKEYNFLNLRHTFECGQCFRWIEKEDGSYIGIAGDKVLEISQIQEGIYFKNTNKKEFEEFWINYFDLQRDYSDIYKKFKHDTILYHALEYGQGLRLLNQDTWETMISFIISSNNNIPRIKKIISNLCINYGKQIKYKNEIYYSFPTPEEMKDVTIEEFRLLKCGYRAKYLHDAVEKVLEGVINLQRISTLITDDARKELMVVKGIGKKVADCILLFSMNKYDCYPTDVWISKIMKEFYLETDTSIKNIHMYSKNKWGEYAGFVQQYLFYYFRSNWNNTSLKKNIKSKIE